MRDDALVLPSEFVRRNDTVQLAICPVNIVFKHRQGVGMQQIEIASDHLLSPSAIVIAEINIIQLGIGKIDSFIRNIERDAVGPEYFRRDDCSTIRSVESDTFDSRVLSPIGPE